MSRFGQVALVACGSPDLYSQVQMVERLLVLTHLNVSSPEVTVRSRFLIAARRTAQEWQGSIEVINRFVVFSDRVVDPADTLQHACLSQKVTANFPELKTLVHAVERLLIVAHHVIHGANASQKTGFSALVALFSR